MQFDDKDIVQSARGGSASGGKKEKKKAEKKSAADEPRVKIQAKMDSRLRGNDNDTPAIPSPQVASVPVTKEDWLRLIDALISSGFIGLMFALPLFFLPFTTDPLELNKQALLVFGTLALALLSSVRMLVAGTIDIKLSSVYAGLTLVLGGWLLSSILSHYPYLSFLGLDRQEYMSFVTVAALAFFVILLAHAERRLIFFALCALAASLSLASVVGILELYGISPVMPLGSIEIWGPASVLAILLSVGLLGYGSWLNNEWKMRGSIFLAISIGIQLITLLILDDWRLWTSVVAGLLAGIALLFWKLKDERPHLWVIVPTALLVVSLLGIVMHLRITPLPLTVQPTWMTSADLSWKTIAASPLFGFGPGTFLESYTRFRPASINSVNFLNLWSTRFDAASAVVFSVIAAIGVIGMIALLVFLVLLIRKIVVFFKKTPLGDNLLLMLALTMPLAGSIALVIMKPSNISLLFIESALVGGILALIPKSHARFSGTQSNRFLILSSSLTSIAGAALLLMLVIFSGRYGADLLFAKALAMDRELSDRIKNGSQVSPDDVDAVIAKINGAIQKNPFVDTYYRTLSQALLTKATSLVHSGSQDIGAIQALVENILLAAKKATELNQNDVRNQENLASMYEQIASFTGGADNLAVETYKKAAILDPNNPHIPLTVAKMHLLLADAHRKRASAEKDPKNSPETALALKETLDAERAIGDALKLKNNLPAAHYYLAVVKSQTGDNKQAAELLTTAAQENASLISSQAADPQLFSQIATSFAALGEQQKALDTVRVALSLMPDDQQSLWLYGNLLADTGKKDEALSVLGKLLEKNPKNDAVIKRLQELKGIAPAPAAESPQTAASSTEESAPNDSTQKE